MMSIIMKKIIGKKGNSMKKIIALLFCISFFTNAMAQESKFVGTWKGIYRSFYTDYEPKNIIIRISIIDGDYQVRIKTYTPQDSTNCSYENNFYGTEQNGSILKWYHKYQWQIKEDSENYKKYGAIYEEGKCYHCVTYKGGALYYKRNYWSSGFLYDNKGKIVHAYDEENQFKEFIEEAVLYKDDDKW